MTALPRSHPRSHRLRHPRLLHPVAWWAWAFALAAAARATLNPMLLLLIGAVIGWVVLERRESRRLGALGAFFALGVAALVLRVVMTALLGGAVVGPTVAFTLPEVALPGWMAGVRLGGEVSLEGLVWSGFEALQLVVMLLAIGAANVLAAPTRLLRYLPATLYDVGTAIVVGLTYAPTLAADAMRVRRARTLRGHSGAGVRELGRIALPVLAGALENALTLAAAMESRGYGRSAGHDPARARRTSAVTVLALIGVIIGGYGLLAGSTPVPVAALLVGGGLGLAAGALALGRRGDRRSHYRRERWGAAETVVVLAAMVPGVVLTVGEQQAWPGITPAQMPLAVPALPALAALAVLVAALAGIVTPEVPERAHARRASGRTSGTSRTGSTGPRAVRPMPSASPHMPSASPPATATAATATAATATAALTGSVGVRRPLTSGDDLVMAP